MPDATLHGDLSTVSLAGVLQLLEAEACTGALEVQGRGVVHLAAGQPVHARFGEFEGVAAFVELFLDDGGEFSFSRVTPTATQVLGPVLGLIMEGCRLGDEWRKLGPQTLAPGPDAARLPDPSLIGAHDGRRTVRDAVRAVARPRSVVIDPILESLRLGQLVPAPTPTSAAPVAETLDYDLAIDEGRRAVRSGDLAAAEAAFEAALGRRPGDAVARQNLRFIQRLRSGERSGPQLSTFRRR